MAQDGRHNKIMNDRVGPKNTTFDPIYRDGKKIVYETPHREYSYGGHKTYHKSNSSDRICPTRREFKHSKSQNSSDLETDTSFPQISSGKTSNSTAQANSPTDDTKASKSEFKEDGTHKLVPCNAKPKNPQLDIFLPGSPTGKKADSPLSPSNEFSPSGKNMKKFPTSHKQVYHSTSPVPISVSADHHQTNPTSPSGGHRYNSSNPNGTNGTKKNVQRDKFNKRSKSTGEEGHDHNNQRYQNNRKYRPPSDQKGQDRGKCNFVGNDDSLSPSSNSNYPTQEFYQRGKRHSHPNRSRSYHEQKNGDRDRGHNVGSPNSPELDGDATEIPIDMVFTPTESKLDDKDPISGEIKQSNSSTRSNVSKQLDTATHPIVSKQIDTATHPNSSKQIDTATHPNVSKQIDTATHPNLSKQIDTATHPIVSKQIDTATHPNLSKQIDTATHPIVSKQIDTATHPYSSKQIDTATIPLI